MAASAVRGRSQPLPEGRRSMRLSRLLRRSLCNVARAAATRRPPRHLRLVPADRRRIRGNLSGLARVISMAAAGDGTH